MQPTFRAFHGDAALKSAYVERLEERYLLRDIVQHRGIWNGTAGTAVGCTIESEDYARYSTTLGLPEWFAWTVDAIFEGLPADDSALFAVQILEAVPVGANIEPVRWKLAISRHHAMLELLQHDKERYAAPCREVIQQSLRHCERMLSGYESETVEQAAVVEIERLARAAEARAREIHDKHEAIESRLPALADWVVRDPKREARRAKNAAIMAADAVTAAVRAIEAPRSAGKSIKAAASAVLYYQDKYFQKEAATLMALVGQCHV